MWFIYLVAIAAACLLAYRFRVPIASRILGQSRSRIDRHLNRRD